MKKVVLLICIIFKTFDMCSQGRKVFINDLKGEEKEMYGLLKRAMNLKSNDSASVHFFNHVMISDSKDFKTIKTCMYDSLIYDSIKFSYSMNFIGNNSSTYSGEIRFEKIFVPDPNMKSHTANPRPIRARKPDIYTLNIKDGLPLFDHMIGKTLFTISSVKPFFDSKYITKAVFQYDQAKNQLDPVLYSKLNSYSPDSIKRKFKLFTKDYVIVQEKNKYGIVSPTGFTYFPIVYSNVQRITSELFFVRHHDKCGLLSLQNEYLIPIEFDDIRPVNNEIIAIRKGQKWAAFEIKNMMFITDFNYDAIKNLNVELVIVRKEEKFGAIDRKGNNIIPLNCTTVEFDFTTGNYKAYSIGSSYSDSAKYEWYSNLGLME